jgi:hypothetical protein
MYIKIETRKNYFFLDLGFFEMVNFLEEFLFRHRSFFREFWKTGTHMPNGYFKNIPYIFLGLFFCFVIWKKWTQLAFVIVRNLHTSFRFKFSWKTEIFSIFLKECFFRINLPLMQQTIADDFFSELSPKSLLASFSYLIFLKVGSFIEFF